VNELDPFDEVRVISYGGNGAAEPWDPERDERWVAWRDSSSRSVRPI